MILMIELMILGFLSEEPLHGYELRKRMEQLHGYARTISDGTIYPAIKRLIATGALSEEIIPGRGMSKRRMLSLTEIGRSLLIDRLRNAKGHDITDGGRFFVILAFLSILPTKEERDAVLSRRLAFLETPASFFYEGKRPLKASEIDDPYRKGIFVSAAASTKAEKAWLRKQLAVNDIPNSAD